MGKPWGAAGHPLAASKLGAPIVDAPFGFFARKAVALLHFADELVPLTFDHVEVVIGKLAPLLLGLAFELVPVAFDLIPIHAVTSEWLRVERQRDGRRIGSGSSQYFALISSIFGGGRALYQTA